MKFLVTGGAGFIGSNFLHYEVEKYQEDNFICLDALTYAGNYNNIKDLEQYKNYRFVKGDITNRDFIFNLFEEENFDIVVNFAAESHVDNSIKNPNVFFNTNVIGTSNLLDACRTYGITRYHQISTDEVYGDLPLDRPDLSFNEQTQLHPSNPYSASKASADLLVLSYFRTFNLPITISRCSNNYGPYQFPEKLIPVVITKAINNEKIPVYGTGQNVRDWIHVRDHNIGIDQIVRKGRVGEIYNIGGHSEKSNLELVQQILRHLKKSEDLIEFVSDRKGHDLRYAIDSSKIESELNWELTYSFDIGLQETIEWYVNNIEWTYNIRSGEYKYAYKENEQNMKKTETEIQDCYILEPATYGDERGYFSPFLNDKELRSHNIYFDGVVQCNRSKSAKGVVRGLHFQKNPKCQTKIVEVINGSALDIVVDLRVDSPTYGKHTIVLLKSYDKDDKESGKQLYVPRGCAHGFISLEDNTLFQYFVDNDYAPEYEAGIQWNDPDLGIDWTGIFNEHGISNPITSEKDNKQLKLNMSPKYFQYKKNDKDIN